MNNIVLTRLQSKLNYEFDDLALFSLALSHRSVGAANNERLEFLGDSILNFIIARALFDQFESAREGQLSRLRSQLVKGETLAELAREFDLGPCLLLGEGEMKSGGQRRDSILADAVEAIIGAIYIDSDFDTCRQCVLRWYQPRLDDLNLDNPAKDAKTRLQEHLQSRKQPLPDYQVVNIEGEAHAQTFTVECHVSLLKNPEVATASSRRVAEKQSAALALKKLGID
ncbi:MULTISPECIES: ribonuclease III [unclassified Gilvimarinus]|uniref:ribonuclease III n=1 Tax=unclassified Gilvimarinus TaxID=2642066 RepID=UPI0026E215EC|nr:MULTISPECIES: ribonuclease III [unclassified Gilvimarinus]MDO6569937.1 ribonuclease III [Gilvimarinus sp. 2_MG-2023]MDO6747146.1 ribonuclease III [Gilvimarinus sp. 1_MG-2023]